MHESKSIQEVVHTLCVQLSKFKQVDNLYEVEHMQNYSIGLFCNKMAFQFADNRVD